MRKRHRSCGRSRLQERLVRRGKDHHVSDGCKNERAYRALIRYATPSTELKLSAFSHNITTLYILQTDRSKFKFRPCLDQAHASNRSSTDPTLSSYGDDKKTVDIAIVENVGNGSGTLGKSESDSGEESFDGLSETALKSLEKRRMSYSTNLIAVC